MAGTQAAPDGTRATTRGCVTESGHVAPMGPRCVTPVRLDARTRRRARSAAVSAPVSIWEGRFATFFLTTFFLRDESFGGVLFRLLSFAPLEPAGTFLRGLAVLLGAILRF